MKKKIFLGIAFLGIAAIAAFKCEYEFEYEQRAIIAFFSQCGGVGR
jgi:hypothetical protein